MQFYPSTPIFCGVLPIIPLGSLNLTKEGLEKKLLCKYTVKLGRTVFVFLV